MNIKFLVFLVLLYNSLFSSEISKKIDSNLHINPIEYKMEKAAKDAAFSSKIFLLNFAFDELQNNIKFHMNDKYIKAILVKDEFLDENVLFALKKTDESIVFLENKVLPEELKKYKFIKKEIIDKKEYSSTVLGTLTLYYDDANNNLSLTNIINLSAKERQFLKEKKEIKLCIDPNWMPFEAIRNNKLFGMSADYVNLFSKILNTPIVLEPTKTWNESLTKIKNKKCDIIPLAVETQNRQKDMLFTSSYVKTPYVLVTKIGIPFIDDIENVKEKKLAIVKGYALVEKLKQEYENINIIEVDSISDGLQKVQEGKVFAYIDNSIVVNYHIQKEYLGILTVVAMLKQKEELAIAIRNDEFILKNIFQKVVEVLNDEIKQSILDKWVKINYNIKTDYTLMFQLALVFIVIIFLIFLWNRKLSSLNKQLSIQRDKANAATRSKSAFLANMSHEIRTPMHGIVGMTELALKSELNEDSRKYVKKIDKSTKILLAIINDILDFSKIEANKLKLEKAKFNLVACVDSIIDLFEYKIQEKNLQLIKEYELNKNSIYMGDSLRLTQIVSNLISNAIKFTSEGYVKIKIKDMQNGDIRFCIEDTGIGLSKEEQDKLFSPFSQSDESITRQYGGTGLGLAICKQLTSLMGGKIWIDSQKNRGSRFYFEINLEKIDEELKEENIIKENKNKKLSDIKILLVEDNQINQEIVLGLLEDEDISIDIANNGLQAVNIFEPKLYDLILMDIQMPVMDGIKASQKIRDMDKNIPIIALSANIVDEKTKEKNSLYINDYLLKPISSTQLITFINKYAKK